ncbi:hypothetical protein IQ37_19735 [Chryseobacterium piperi]|uniref:Uncharacterized protein n=1 Tax=Chryseobacterium piperi TaxID=558152 RepID=A0A085ZZN7_9FLAO|nr:hypothetical protein [Chryseobacterium piperi]ASW73700.1 hypothetical protein CJF12_04935 [Chryseobacterium piperi]KFF09901.1 hypothetical protein IQ37_19735 [Chryseobacterium piperi]
MWLFLKWLFRVEETAVIGIWGVIICPIPIPCIYDKSDFVKADGRFKEDQFIDTIYVYKEKDNDIYNDHFDTFIIIDSSRNKYFYGTETVEEKNTHNLFSKGVYRFKKSSDPQECYQSKLKTGYFEFYNIDGSLHSKKLYQIKGDSSYVVKK